MNGPHHCIGDCRRAEAQIARQAEEIDALRYERDHWKREAGQLADSDCADTLGHALGLTPTEAAIAAALYRRRERMLPRASIEGLLDEESGEAVGTSMVSVMVGRIRRKLGDQTVENHRGRGYRLSPELLARIDRIVAG